MVQSKEFLDKKNLKNFFPLNSLSALHINEVSKNAQLHSVPPGRILFKKGQYDTKTYFLLAGRIVLVEGQQIVKGIAAGSVDSRRPLVPGQPRPFTTQTASQALVMSVDTQLLNQLLDWEQSAKQEASELNVNGKQSWMAKMLKSELFNNLTVEDKRNLITRMREIKVKKGTTILKQHQFSDEYYVVKQGQCVVSKQANETSKPVLIAELGAGDSFGEEALFGNGHCDATVTMMTNGSLMRLSRYDIVDLV